MLPETDRLRRESGFAGLLDLFEGVDEVLQNFGGNHDGVAATAHVFRDFDELTTIVLLEIHEKHLPVGNHFFSVNRVIVRSAFVLFVTDHS